MKEDAGWQVGTNIWTKNTEKGQKELNILSLDGGGSRGIMESIMLGHIMNLATIMTKNPSYIKEVTKTSQSDDCSITCST